MGTRSLSGIKINFQMSATVNNLLTDSQNATGSINLNYAPKLESGVSQNQANRGWQSAQRSLGSGATEVIDLYDFVGTDIGAGDGKDPVGQTLTLEEIVAIAIVNNNAIDAAGQLEIEPDPVNGWGPIGSHTVAGAYSGALRGQGILFKCNPSEAGFDVLDANHHRLLMTANGGAVTYSIYILGRHDDNESSSSSSSSSSSVSSSSSSSSASSSSST